MSAPIDRAYVEILPDLRQFATRTKEQVASVMRGVAEETRAVNTTVTSSAARMTEESGAAMRDIEAQTRAASAGVASTAATAAAESEGLLTRVKSQFKDLATFILPTLGAIEGYKFFKESIASAQEERKQLAQTNAVLKSTHDAAGVTADQVQRLAVAQSKQTGITQTQIRSNENMLLTFRDVRDEVGKGNNIFDQATKTILDMSVALKEDGKAAAIQLGKALNDPILGVTALRRVGVSFTQQQQAVIKALVQGGTENALYAEGIQVTQTQLTALAKEHHGVAGAVDYLTRSFSPAKKAQFEYYTQGHHLIDAQKMILGELNKEFGGSAAAQATPAQKAAAAWEQFRVELGNRLLPVIDKVETFFTKTLLPSIIKFFDEMGKGEGIGGAVVGVVKALWAVLQPLAESVINLGKEAWPYVQRALAQVTPFLEKTAEWLRQHATLVRTVAVAVIAFWAAWKGYTIIIAVRDAIIGLNAVMIANPIGAVIAAVAALVAAFIYAWNHSETFRDIVKQVWADVKGAFLTAWRYIKPVFNFLVAEFKLTWNVIRTVLNAVIAIWRTTWNVVKAVWGVARPVIETIGKIIYAVIGGTVIGVIKLIQVTWRLTWAAVKAVWNDVIKPTFNAISAVVLFWWRNVVKPTFLLVAAGFKILWNGIQAIWDAVGRPIFNVIKTVVTTLWRDVLKPVFQGIEDAWSTLWTNVESIFGNIWHGIESAIAAGVNGVIDVINFFIGAIDWVLDKLPGNFHIEKIQHVSFGSSSVGSSGSNNTGQRGARGGTPFSGGGMIHSIMGSVFPGYAPGSDRISVPQFMFSPGEGILVPEAVRGLGGKDGIDHLNRTFSQRMGPITTDRFVTGGVTGNPPGGGGNGAVLRGVARGSNAVLTGDGGVGGFITGIAGIIGKLPSEVVGLIRRGIAAVLRAALHAAESPVNAVISALPSGIVHSMAQGGFSAMTSPIESMIDRLGGEARKKAAAAVAHRVGAVPGGQRLSLISRALQLAGVPDNAATEAAVNTIIRFESGWNPNAINLTDSNAAAGHPSKGLMQTVDGTFDTYRLKSLSDNIYNPLANIVAGIRYAVARYGGVLHVPGIVALANGGTYVGYETGAWDVPRNQVAEVHQHEMIVPAAIADAIRKSVRGMSSDARPSAFHMLTSHTGQHRQSGGGHTRTGDRTHTHRPRHHRHHHHHHRRPRNIMNPTGANIQKIIDAYKTFVKATDQGVRATQKSFDALNKLFHRTDIPSSEVRQFHDRERDILDLMRKRIDLTNKLKSAEADLHRVRQQYNSTIKTVQSNILGQFDVTTAGGDAVDAHGNPAPLTASSIIAQLNAIVANARKFSKMIRRLAREGLPKPLLNQLINAGPAAMASAQALLQATPKQLSQLRDSYSDLRNIAHTSGVTDARLLYGKDLHNDLKDVNELTKEVDNVNKNIREDIVALSEELKSTLAMWHNHSIINIPGIGKAIAPAPGTGGRFDLGFNEDKLARAVTRGLEGAELVFDGKGHAKIVTKHQGHQARKGNRP